MGLHYRKSIKLGGGFRVNISSSGVGYSWGIPGYRVTRTASGRTRHTYSIPGTGIRYTEEHNQNSNSQSLSPNQQNQSNNSYSNVHDIESSDITNFQAGEYEDFINSINTVIKLNKLSTLLSICIILAANPLFLIIGIVGILLKIYVYVKGKIDVEYNFDSEKEIEYQKRIDAWKSLNNCDKLWQISQTAKVNNKKTSAGAEQVIQRFPFTINTELPWYLKSNVEAIVLKFKKETMIVLPDKLLLIKKNGIGAIRYSSIKYDIYASRFIEEQQPPKDAEFIRNTWKYVNQNGQPDKRFKNNRQIPVYKYGKIELSSDEGLNAIIMCSNIQIVEEFKRNIL